MPKFNTYSQDGRTLLVRFRCFRCGATHIGELEAYDKDPESYENLHSLKPPKGWKDLLHGPLLCPECFAKYTDFIQGKDLEEANQ